MLIKAENRKMIYGKGNNLISVGILISYALCQAADTDNKKRENDTNSKQDVMQITKHTTSMADSWIYYTLSHEREIDSVTQDTLFLPFWD